MSNVARLGLGLFLLAGCSKEPEPISAPLPAETAPAANSAPSINVQAAEADMSATLNRLTQTLRRYAAEHQRAPANLGELVAAGYLPELPGAPPGQRFVFDEQLRVTLAKAK